MNSLTVFVGDTSEEVSVCAKQFDSTAFLINTTNFNTINKPLLKPTTIYTSLGDLPNDLQTVYNILNQADEIYYVKPNEWSDNKDIDFSNVTNSIQGLTETTLYYFQQQKNNVHGLNLDHYQQKKYTSLRDFRKTQNKQIWVAGCSLSHGEGVDSNQRYGAVIAEELNLPVSFLTANGSSIEWAADQILRSDIHEGDIVIFGLTNEQRIPLWDTTQTVKHINTNNRQNHTDSLGLPIKFLDLLLLHETRIYQAHTHIEQVINFCKKINAKLLILGLFASDSTNILLHNHQEFITYKNLINNKFIDLGTDNHHPGPKQHKLYADFCLNQFKKLNYI